MSEIWPSGTGAAAPAEASGQDAAAYQTQLEQRLSGLIGEIEGAGQATVMITLESGEETIYALDTQSGQTQSQQTHVLLEDGTALEETVYFPAAARSSRPFLPFSTKKDKRITARRKDRICA